MQTEKDRHFRYTNQQRQILGLANTTPDMQTNRIRHANRETQALKTYKPTKTDTPDIQTNNGKHFRNTNRER